ncbi:hypothetical protein PMIN06_013047 [Paraphaeosphaeria minitans]
MGEEMEQEQEGSSGEEVVEEVEVVAVERETEREGVQRAFQQQQQVRRAPRQRLMQVQQEAYANM